MEEQTNNKNTVRNKYEGRHGLVYVRVSSKRQETHGHGRESQEKRCLDDLESIKVPYEETFADTYTGGGDFLKRPAMRAVIEYIDAHPERKYVLIFDDLKRFARDSDFHFRLRTEFRVRDVELRCLNYNFDESPEGIFMERVFAAQGELERKQNRRQVIDKMKARLDMGYWPFKAKKGYSIVKQEGHGKIGVPDRNAPILKEALERFSRGHLARKIDFCKFLVEKRLWGKRPPEKFLDQAHVILTDCYYTGDIEYRPWGVTRREGKHQGIISAAVFEKNQKRLRKSVPTGRVRKVINPDFPARGLVVCACQKPLTATWSKGRSRRYAYYLCFNKACPSFQKYIPAQFIEDGFIQRLQNAALTPDAYPMIEVMFERGWNQEITKAADQDAARLERTKELDEEIRDLAKAARKASSDSVRQIYEAEIDEAAVKLGKLREISEKNNGLAIPYRTALAKATQFLKDPYFAWQKAAPEEQHHLYAFVFDEKLTYDPKSGYRTAEVLTAARLFEEFATANSGIVDIVGRTLNRIEEYLIRFWEYYQSSTVFREALERMP